MFPSLYLSGKRTTDSGVMNPIHGVYTTEHNDKKYNNVEDYSSFFTETDGLMFSLNNQLRNKQIQSRDYYNPVPTPKYQNQDSYSSSAVMSYAEGWTGHLLPEVICKKCSENIFCSLSECWRTRPEISAHAVFKRELVINSFGP